MKKNKIIKHLKGDIETFKHEAQEDRELIHDMKKGRYVMKEKAKKDPKPKKLGKKQQKIKKVMREFKKGVLHSGSKKGPKVKSRRQAVAIAMSESRRAKKRK